MKKLLLLLLCFGLPMACNELRPGYRRAIQRLISEAISKEKIPGLSAAVVSDGQIVYSGAFGQADMENQVPVTDKSLFRTASVAKPITATAALRLVAAGRLNLDAPIQDYCQAFPGNHG